MKAITGTEITSTRGLLDEAPEDTVAPSIYAAEIVEAKRRYPSLVVQIQSSECFAAMWEDAGEVCDLVHCGIRTACQESYNAAHAIKPVAPPVVVVPKPSHKKKLFGDQTKRRQLVPGGSMSTRNKWKGTGKYQRQGYANMGRPVDRALGHLIEGLGSPPILPKGWHHTQFAEHYSKLGRLLLSQTTGYTSVMVDGAVLMRFWTNAGGCALLDFVPEISGLFSSFKKFSRIVEIPAGSKKKLAPCTHRVQLGLGTTTHQEMLALLGAQIRMAYKL